MQLALEILKFPVRYSNIHYIFTCTVDDRIPNIQNRNNADLRTQQSFVFSHSFVLLTEPNQIKKN